MEQGSSVTITVNKLPEEKNVPVSVNLESLLNGDIYESSQSATNNTSQEENETTTSKKDDIKKVKVRITVNDQEKDLGKSEYNANDTILTNVSGRGKVVIKVYINNRWANKSDTDPNRYTFDLSSINQISID